MIALGLDVSELRMGWAFVSWDTQAPIALGVENLRKPDEGWIEEQVLAAMRNVRAELVRLGHGPEEVVVVGIESAYHGPSIKRTIAHAGVVGMATVAAQVTFGRQATCYPLGADEWRAACGISNAGKSADKKAAALVWAEMRLIDGRPEPPTHEELLAITEDSADALGIATAAALKTEAREAAA